MKYPICCITDEGYAQHCGAMLCSLFENNKNGIFVIHILTSGLSDTTRNRLMGMIRSYNSECMLHQVDELNLRKIRGVQISRVFSNYATYYKLLLSSIIDEKTGVVLYLDSDTIVNGEIIYIFDLDISNYALAAVEDVPSEYEHRMHLSLPYTAKYFNAGVMLVNLDYWRENAGEKRLLQFAEREKYTFFHDQDALNSVFRDQWFALHPRWNKYHMYPCLYPPRFSNWKDEYLFNKYPLIIHYTGYPKPWHKFPFTPYGRLYRKYLRLALGLDSANLQKVNFGEACLHLSIWLLQKMHLYFLLRHLGLWLKRK
jgi:lipopolysaccharide biosynthesis glycosyltransferase